MDEHDLAERLLQGKHLPPDIPRSLALAAYHLSIRLRQERQACSVCGYPESTIVNGKRYCPYHIPIEKKGESRD